MLRFEEYEIAIINEFACKGLPNRVGEVAEVLNFNSSPNYDYHVVLDDGDIVPVKDKELNKVTEEQLQLMTYIKRGSKVVYAPMNEKVGIVKVDYLHGQVEVKFYDSAMSIIGFEQLRQIENGEEVEVKELKFQIGDRVEINSEDEWNGLIGEVSGVQYYDEGIHEYLVDVNDKIGCPFIESELELVTEEDQTKEYYLDLFFGHYENEDGTYTVPKQLLHKLVGKLI